MESEGLFVIFISQMKLRDRNGPLLLCFVLWLIKNKENELTWQLWFLLFHVIVEKAQKHLHSFLLKSTWSISSWTRHLNDLTAQNHNQSFTKSAWAISFDIRSCIGISVSHIRAVKISLTLFNVLCSHELGRWIWGGTCKNMAAHKCERVTPVGGLCWL